MPQTRPPYPPEFRQRIVELARAGRTVQELAAEFEPSELCVAQTHTIEPGSRRCHADRESPRRSYLESGHLRGSSHPCRVARRRRLGRAGLRA